MGTRRAISRDAVVRGAMRQFAADGSVDMQSLAGDLAISRATLYRVAGSRDALLGEALWRLGRRLLDRARTERVRRGIDGVIEVSRIFDDRLSAAPRCAPSSPANRKPPPASSSPRPAPSTAA